MILLRYIEKSVSMDIDFKRVRDSVKEALGELLGDTAAGIMVNHMRYDDTTGAFWFSVRVQTNLPTTDAQSEYIESYDEKRLARAEPDFEDLRPGYNRSKFYDLTEKDNER
jgi:hypothetical protein